MGHNEELLKNVREVVEKLIPAMELPGGVYNFGSGNDANMFDTATRFARMLHADVTLEKDHWTRNLVMDGQKLAAFGIRFDSTLDAFARCLKDYGF